MAPRYPTYQRSAQLSASIVTPPNIDQAALREQAKGYASMAEGADRVMNFAFKEGEKEQNLAAQHPVRQIRQALLSNSAVSGQ